MSRKASNIGNGRRLRLMPLNILGGGPIIVDVDEEERKRQKRRLERAQALVEAEALKKAQEEALVLVQAQAKQAEEEEQKKREEQEKQEKGEQPPNPTPGPEAAVPASPARSAATIRIRELTDELMGTRTIEFRIDETSPKEQQEGEDKGEGTGTAEGDGLDKPMENKPREKKKTKGAKKDPNKSAWVTYLDESIGSSREDADADEEDDTDVSAKADDGLEDHIRHLATRLCIGDNGDKPTKETTETGASASKHQKRRRRRRSSYNHQQRQMHFFSDVDNAKGTREVRLEAYSKGKLRDRDEDSKRLLDEKSNAAAAEETKSTDDAPRVLPAPPGSQNGQDLPVNDPGNDYDAHRDRFHRSRTHREHYVETLPLPPRRPVVDFHGHPIPPYAPPYGPYPAYPFAYAPPPPPPMYPPYHTQPPYVAYGPPPPPPEHPHYYYDHYHRRASDQHYAPTPYAPYAPTPPSPRSPARHHSSGSVRSGVAGGRPPRDGPNGYQQSGQSQNVLPYGGEDNAATWHDPDAAGLATGENGAAWNQSTNWTTHGAANNMSKHTKDRENSKSSNDANSWGINWDNENNENKGKDAENAGKDNSNNGWGGWNADENKTSKSEPGWASWNTEKTKDTNNNSNNNNSGWGSETKKNDGNSGWDGWDAGSSGAKSKSKHYQASNNSNNGGNGDNDNTWGLGGDGNDDNGNGNGDYADTFASGGGSNDLWSGGNNMATMAENDNNMLPGAWPPSDGCDLQQSKQTSSSQGENIAW